MTRLTQTSGSKPSGSIRGIWKAEPQPEDVRGLRSGMDPENLGFKQVSKRTALMLLVQDQLENR